VLRKPGEEALKTILETALRLTNNLRHKSDRQSADELVPELDSRLWRPTQPTTIYNSKQGCLPREPFDIHADFRVTTRNRGVVRRIRCSRGVPTSLTTRNRGGGVFDGTRERSATAISSTPSFRVDILSIPFETERRSMIGCSVDRIHIYISRQGGITTRNRGVCLPPPPSPLHNSKKGASSIPVCDTNHTSFPELPLNALQPFAGGDVRPITTRQVRLIVPPIPGA
jgi:hypothetical protein